MVLGLGIDTGGTYTDSVVIDTDTKEIVCRSKALTTRDDLIKGIVASLKGLSKTDGISIVSLSSTLATNSIVEGKSCRVGLIVLGKKFGHTVNVANYAYIDAQLDLKGRTVKKLDMDEAKAAVESMRGKVDVLAIVGYMSVRNPSHEETVRNLADKMLGIPVVCAHELTSKLGFEQRANTAIINAGLIPTIIDLIKAVTKALEDLGIEAPLMIVKGDGSIMNAATAIRRPIETIMSGPASSLTSAMVHTGIQDALISDIGGTTTDLGIIHGGFVRTLDTGALVGGHRTRVRAADVSTYGMGGDSRISVEKGKIVLSTIRIIPVCIAASRWPEVKQWINGLESLKDSPSDTVADCEFYTRASNMEMSYLTESDKRFLKLIEQRPYAVREASEVTEIPYDRFCLKDLESEGYVTRIGVTPTDILAAEGTYKEYDTEASRKAVELLAKKAEMDMDTFIAKTKEAIVHKICRCIMDHIIRAETGKDELSKSDEAMIEEVLCQRKEYDVGFRLKMPIVGIGAPVGAWLPKVAEKLNTELILPENYDVGNAIGAISSSVTEVVELSVRAAFQDFSDDPECTVYNGEEAFDFSDKDEALEFAVEEATRIATARAIESGAAEVSIEKKIDQMLIDVEGNGKKVFRGATVIVRASGKPMMHWFD
ncbi:MAG: hydantoinase/oxoprolinase family protein [Candidatus Methanomethylophilaceae archaeon]|nr:hydantoinase/oxoprolinase family protein [Candidatus Methanomethylophilaceae archaeon]